MADVTTTPVASPTTSYTVNAGDTASGIAQSHGLSPSEFLALNPSFGAQGHANDYQGLRGDIQVGQSYVVPNRAGGAGAGGSGPANPNDLHALINGNQGNDINNNTENPPTRDSNISPYTSAFGDLKSTLLGGATAPTAPNFEGQYNDLKSSYGVDSLTSRLNELNTQESTIQASKRESVASEMDKPVAMNVISGRVSEQERNFNQKLDTISLQKTALTDQLKTANDAIDTVMKYKTLDYNNAKDTYDKQLTQNLAMYNTISGQMNREEDNARANLSIIYNAIQNGGATLDSISPTQKSLISSLELKSGLPSGFYQFLQNKNPKADVLSTTTRDDNGQKYSDVLFRDPKTGAVYSKSYALGATSTKAGDQVVKFNQDQKNSLVGLGMSSGDVSVVEDALNKYGLDAVVNSGKLSKDQIDTIKLVFNQ